jgi:hypothetical protein
MYKRPAISDEFKAFKNNIVFDPLLPKNYMGFLENISAEQ